ncbi:hypothetical protein [Clostridium sp. D33t1_170424_F3]|uniref:hypothetical protein n=1 Tax=Clostridium sp. D33t1_170424_F3 TaxID=2787099 RepID=UPI0018A95879|nr:hypothetical protein [Clostridium sp. D33t1_170424_F3]
MKKMLKRVICFCMALCICTSLTACTKDVQNEPVTVEVGAANDEGGEKAGKFTGTLEDGKPSGEGTIVFDDGWTFKGEFEKGVAGKGAVTDLPMVVVYDGTEYQGTYDGDVDMGIAEGTGKFVCNGEDRTFQYEGEWTKGEMTGKGSLNAGPIEVQLFGETHKGTYIGEMQDGKLQGKGTFTDDTDADPVLTYTGEWKAGFCDGQGYLKDISEEKIPQKGTFTKGEFTPTVLEAMQSVGMYKEAPYTVSETGAAFISAHDDLFLDHNVEAVAKAVEADPFDYLSYAKNTDSCDGKLVKIPNLHVVQITEQNYWGADRTQMILCDSLWEQTYQVDYVGKIPDVVQGDQVTLFAMPIDYFAYKNTQNNQVLAVAAIGALVKKE